MTDRPRLSRLALRNLLSFGPEGVDVELRALNVLIGPNASGKSNFIEALSLLGALPADLSVPIREGGGIREWLWRGGNGRKVPTATISAEAGDASAVLRHRFELGAAGPRPAIADEHIEFARLDDSAVRPRPVFRWRGGQATLHDSNSALGFVGLPVTDFKDGTSILAQSAGRQEPLLDGLRQHYIGFRTYRDWDTSRRGPLRAPQAADLPEDLLMPDAQNLGVVLNNLQRYPEAWAALNQHLSRLHPSLHEVRTLVQANTVQIMLQEKDLRTLTPAARMSDGTLRWLALLAVLLHPEPPSLVAIEEPELGLHPDLIGDLAKLLVDASTRTQVVVTTHSDHLIDALSSDPGAVLVAEREPEGTTLRRLDAAHLAEWLEKYRLGELWLKGEIGGTRW